MSLLSIISTIGGRIRTSTHGGSSYTPIASVEGIIRSLGTNTYSAFPHTAGFSDGEIAMIFKESASHGASGAIMFGTSDGALDYGFSQLVVNSVSISGTNLGTGITSTDRWIIDWQESTAGPIKIAYSDNRGTSWAMATNSFTYPSGYAGAQFGKIIELGGGGLLKFYYLAPTDPNDPTISGCLKSSDNGATWAKLADIAIRYHWDSGTESGNDALINGRGKTSEIHGVVTEMGATDADTKIIVMLRAEEHSLHLNYRSSDGGATWERLAGTSSAYTGFEVYGPTAEGRIPVHLIEHDGLIYMFAGLRQAGNYRIAYTTATPANAWANTWSSISELSYESNADNNGSYIDFGYPEPLSRIFPAQSISEILVPFYDTSVASSGSPRDMIIYQKVIAT